MTETGIIKLVDRFIGHYATRYKGMTEEDIGRMMKEIARDFQAFNDDDVDEAFTTYTHLPDAENPPSFYRLKTLIKQPVVRERETTTDKTRLCVDEEGRLWYNQLFEEVKSEIDPNKTLTRPIPGTRPFDGKKGFTPIRVPLGNEELVALSKKRGWKYEVTENPNGAKRYSWSKELMDYLDMDRTFIPSGGVDGMVKTMLRK